MTRKMPANPIPTVSPERIAFGIDWRKASPMIVIMIGIMMVGPKSRINLMTDKIASILYDSSFLLDSKKLLIH